MSPQEQALVELSQWLGRTLQYSASHPACAELAEATHATFLRALAAEPQLSFGVLKDDVLIGDAAAKHPAIRGRLAPYLHERGVLALRFHPGLTVEELTAFVVLLTLPPQSVFDRGGMASVARERGISHLQIEEIAHDITHEEREAQRRRKRLREFFKELLRNLLARREGAVAAIGAHLAEMLEHPDLAVAILEEDGGSIAEAAAGLALMVQQEERRSGVELASKLRNVLLLLSPPARDRALLGLPSLMGEFRQALVWALDGLTPDQLARLFFPSLRARATDLDATLYAISAAVVHEGTRLSALRRAGLSLFDLRSDDPTVMETVSALAAPVPEYASFRRERDCLQQPAHRALTVRGELLPSSAAEPPPPFDGGRAISEVVGMARRTKGFGRLCGKLPRAARAFAATGAIDAAVGAIMALEAVAEPEWRDVARGAARDVAASSAPAVLARLDARSASASTKDLDEIAEVVRVLTVHAPAAVLDRLDVSESRKMRRLMLDMLPLVGPSVLPLLPPRLRSGSWYVVRNAVVLVGRCQGAVSDLEAAVRHANWRVRLEVVRALRAMPPSSATMDIAASYLVDESHDVETGARSLLRGELLGPAAIAQVAALASEEARPEELRRVLIDVLGRSPRDEAAAALFQCMQPAHLLDLGPAAALRDAAAAALRGSPAPSAAEHFAAGLGSTVKRVRRACERAAESG